MPRLSIQLTVEELRELLDKTEPKQAAPSLLSVDVNGLNTALIETNAKKLEEFTTLLRHRIQKTEATLEKLAKAICSCTHLVSGAREASKDCLIHGGARWVEE
jgi:hypothetical protein